MIKVLGLGDNVVDKYLHIKTMYPGGNALNISALAKLSGIDKVGYLGVFGDDEAGRHVYHTIKNIGIDVSMCRFYNGENGFAEVRLEEGDRVFVGSNKGGVSKKYPIKLTNFDKEYIADFDVCHTSIFSYVEDILPEIRKVSSFISMDFSDRYDDSYLKKCCPYIDMAEISCGNMEKEEIMKQMEKISQYGCKHVIMATRGSLGALLLVDGKCYEQSPYIVDAVDTMAAGDSFITSFLIHYITGMKVAKDFPEDSGNRGITSLEEYQDNLVKVALYNAAIFAAENCKRDGSFGFGKKFE